MTADARPDDAPTEDDDSGMTVAAVVTIVAIGAVWLGLAVGWMWSFHAAGTGRGLW